MSQMSINEQQLMEGYVKSFTDNLNVSLCFHLLKLVVENPEERDTLIIDITEHFIQHTTPLLESVSKDNIFLKSKCINVVKTIAGQFLYTEAGRAKLKGDDLPTEKEGEIVTESDKGGITQTGE